MNNQQSIESAARKYLAKLYSKNVMDTLHYVGGYIEKYWGGVSTNVTFSSQSDDIDITISMERFAPNYGREVVSIETSIDGDISWN